jgi:hypothetical protein
VDTSSSPPLPARAARLSRAGSLRGCACGGLRRLLVSAALLLASSWAHAQGAATQPGQTRSDAAPPEPGFAYDLGHWPGLIRSAFQDALAPVLSSLKDFVRPVRHDALGWGNTPPAERLPADAARPWPDLGRATGEAAADSRAFALQPPTLSLGYAGVGPGVGLTRFRIPWLLTPESALRATPTLTLAGPGSLRMDLMAGSVGGRSGASAAFGMLVYRF